MSKTNETVRELRDDELEKSERRLHFYRCDGGEHRSSQGP